MDAFPNPSLCHEIKIRRDGRGQVTDRIDLWHWKLPLQQGYERGWIGHDTLFRVFRSHCVKRDRVRVRREYSKTKRAPKINLYRNIISLCLLSKYLLLSLGGDLEYETERRRLARSKTPSPSTPPFSALDHLSCSTTLNLPYHST